MIPFMFSVVAKVIGNIVFHERFGKAAEMLGRFNYILPVLVPIFDLCLMPLIIVNIFIFSLQCSVERPEYHHGPRKWSEILGNN